jgi:hypothetical protein
MQNEFANRQNMHLTIIGLLDKDEFQPVWKPPTSRRSSSIRPSPFPAASR